MIGKSTNTKIKHILKEIARAKEETLHIEIIDNSRFVFKEHWNHREFPNAYDLKIYTSPDIYYKYLDLKFMFQKEIKDRINKSTDYLIDSLDWVLDMSKLEVNQIDVILVKTEWEEINELQKKLIDSLKKSIDSIDYQNIGNTSRSIMDKLAREVFDKGKHIPKDSSIEVHNGKFKNQLNTFVSSELSGKSNKELRKIAESSINLVSDSIDVMNKTTHKLDADKRFAELCVISTISVINVVKIISDFD
ncbi:hypothetical protein [Winogradskyella psychrotolerans]|uniref:hypothetical protein n=1 Tax=Winogradskyella psychrotolerans TaxID=1344585 RepID=UPI001C075679|nr:hypothetical protein [Winogradskyella psychrotolerans]MBU2928691.1 hypothetical protein [Winogradskyella psychrotolerans]